MQQKKTIKKLKFQEGTCQHQYRRMFFSQNAGVPASLHYPAISYSNDSPIYGSFGDFSYTDSSSDLSPTIAHRWSIDDDSYGPLEKNFIGFDHGKENTENRARIDQNRQNYEKTLNMETNDESSDELYGHTNGNLSTINEEATNIADNPRI